MDRAWWKTYLDETQKTFLGFRCSPIGGLAGVHKIKFNHSLNSGAGAISLAAHWGAEKIILIGYDCQATGGKVHWFGNHPKGLGNAGSMSKWPAHFADVAKRNQHIDIVNCSRATALNMFKKAELDEVLNGDS